MPMLLMLVVATCLLLHCCTPHCKPQSKFTVCLQGIVWQGLGKVATTPSHGVEKFI